MEEVLLFLGWTRALLLNCSCLSQCEGEKIVWVCDRQPMLLEEPEHHYLRQQLEELLDAL